MESMRSGEETTALYAGRGGQRIEGGNVQIVSQDPCHRMFATDEEHNDRLKGASQARHPGHFRWPRA